MVPSRQSTDRLSCNGASSRKQYLDRCTSMVPSRQQYSDRCDFNGALSRQYLDRCTSWCQVAKVPRSLTTGAKSQVIPRSLHFICRSSNTSITAPVPVASNTRSLHFNWAKREVTHTDRCTSEGARRQEYLDRCTSGC
ncbi:hypothetical protein AVEN_105893-1 [Araneus ventricosus]|uniref:Uncharacterized protein n=1 Tax=Araneus ventricosus TaxID=182803 RepID=A0A4Y2MDR2_ARAVE|nr:hypothetical protein AVEN_105893-1 [Araneus ventricosus]